MSKNDPKLEWKCREDEAWYLVEVDLIRDHTVLRIHYSEFPDDEDEECDVRFFRDEDHVRTRFRLSAFQLQDAHCRDARAGAKICACCYSDGLDMKYFDAVIKKVEFSEHAFPDGQEVCNCKFDILWYSGPNVGKVTSVSCENICLINDGDIKAHPVMKTLLGVLENRKVKAEARKTSKSKFQDNINISLPSSRVTSIQSTEVSAVKTYKQESDTAESTFLNKGSNCSEEGFHLRSDSESISEGSGQERVDSCNGMKSPVEPGIDVSSYTISLKYMNSDATAVPSAQKTFTTTVLPEDIADVAYAASQNALMQEGHAKKRTCETKNDAEECEKTDGYTSSLNIQKRQKLSSKGNIQINQSVNDCHSGKDKTHVQSCCQPNLHIERKCLTKASELSNHDAHICLPDIIEISDDSPETSRDHIHENNEKTGKFDTPSALGENPTNIAQTLLYTEKFLHDTHKEGKKVPVHGFWQPVRHLEQVKREKNISSLKEIYNASSIYSGNVLYIDNLEKDLSPLELLDVLDSVLTVAGIEKVVISPALCYERFAKGFVFFKDNPCALKAYEVFQRDFFIVSPKGRPWVAFKPLELVYRKEFGGFTVNSSKDREKSFPLVSGKVRIVYKDSPEYGRADRLKKIFMEFMKNYRSLHEIDERWQHLKVL